MAAVANKEARQLNPEDFGRASGILEIIQSLTPTTGRVTVILPSGTRKELPEFSHEQALAQIREAVSGWQSTFSLSPDQLAALLIIGVLESAARTSGRRVARPSLNRLAHPSRSHSREADVTEEVVIDLVYDPHRIYAGEGQRISGLAQELAAFHAICDQLRQSGDPATRLPRCYILDRIGWEHFRSIRGIKGVRPSRVHTPCARLSPPLGPSLPSG